MRGTRAVRRAQSSWSGGGVDGRKIDIYVDDCAEATRWGRRQVVAEVLDLGREAV